MDFNFFVPKNSYEWVLLGLLVILMLVLFLYNKALMKCKTIIEKYVLEIKDLRTTLQSNGIEYSSNSFTEGD